MTFPVVHPQAKESRPYDICNYSILVGSFLDVPITIINFQLSLKPQKLLELSGFSDMGVKHHCTMNYYGNQKTTQSAVKYMDRTTIKTNERYNQFGSVSTASQGNEDVRCSNCDVTQSKVRFHFLQLIAPSFQKRFRQSSEMLVFDLLFFQKIQAWEEKSSPKSHLEWFPVVFGEGKTTKAKH